MKKSIIESLIAGVILILISKGIDKYGGSLMKEIYKTFIIDLWWMWLGIAGFVIYFLLSYAWSKYKKFEKDFREFSESTKQSVRQAIIKSEMLEQEPIIKWLTYHSPNYKQQEFSSLEEKINYLARIEMEFLEDRIKKGIVKDETK